MKMKRILSIVTVIAVLALVLTGCGGNDSQTGSSSTASDSGSSSSGSSVSENAFEKNMEIAVCSREDGSGTRGAFIELFGVEQKDADGNKVDMTTEEALTTNSTSVMMTTVSESLYSIGYCSLGSLNETVKAVKIDGVDASVANIKSDDYKIARPFNIVTGDNLSDIANDFIDYILSADGQAVIESAGYIAVSDAPAYEGSKPEGKLVIAGSSSVTPAMEKLVEAYEKLNTGADIQIQESDSSTGIQNAINGVCDIGMASRDLKESETGVTSTKIAMDGIAVIVNLDCPIDALTSEQVCSIYTGETTVWADLID